MPDEQGSANQRPEHDPLRDDDDLGGNRQPGPGEPPRASAADLGQPAADLGQPADEHRASGHDHLGASHTSPLGQPPFGTSGAYGQPGTYGQFGGYGQPGAYGEFRGYGQPGAYGQFGGYGQPGAYGQFGGYGQPPPPAPRPRRRRNIITYLAVAVVAAAIGASATGYALDGTGSSASGGTQSSGPSGGGGIFPGLPGSGNSRNSGGSGNAGRSVSSATISAVEQKIRPALVDISSNLGYQGSQAAATGMIISSNGIVLTNNHVITDTTQLYATLVDGGRRYTARWLGYDASADVAVIQLVGAHNLPTVSLGNSSAVRLGQPVIALGNANGQGGAPAAAGTITALDRTITANDSGAGTSETLHGMLQTDADIVPGDSGGALASTSGQVIGMNTAAATAPFNTAQNRGFAIPIDTAIQIARKIISGHGGAGIQIGSTGFLGVLVPAGQASQTSNPRQQRQLQLQQDENGSGFPVQPSTPACLPNDLTAGVPARVAPVSSGALIIGELCGTPADKAGLIAGDVITAVGRQKVTSPQDLTGVMHGFRPGNTVQVTWVDTAGQVHHSAMALVQAPPR